ncbi:hypothetical protein [Sinomicrobium soli]|uniref:hypothetical protein n=1 Tax=Sinomicrobium sp. N-1-3-6 TaxID=2219864 RepID=UPI000DCC4810|nr:hypothetical protein [Sinomicrobium sp. N-1-3-6]RAV30776.1 hypothetical protein DN748_00510 [Sinomicrobium sp. N-1-3-6]
MRALKIIGFVIFKLAFIALYVCIVMLLWNWLMPSVFGIVKLDFWQTLGILLLCKLLFLGSGWNYRRNRKFSPRHGKQQWKSEFRKKWMEKMCNAQDKSNEQ